MDDHRAGKIVVFLNGRLNKCGVISPRFDVALNDIEKWASNLLPSRQFGYVQVGVHEVGKRVHLIPMFPPSWKRNGNWIHLMSLIFTHYDYAGVRIALFPGFLIPISVTSLLVTWAWNEA